MRDKIGEYLSFIGHGNKTWYRSGGENLAITPVVTRGNLLEI